MKWLRDMEPPPHGGGHAGDLAERTREFLARSKSCQRGNFRDGTPRLDQQALAHLHAQGKQIAFGAYTRELLKEMTEMRR